jgi:signal transduction histidine kinase/CheY-like chemotaxis protein
MSRLAVTNCFQSSTSHSSLASEASLLKTSGHLPPLTNTIVSAGTLNSTPPSSEPGTSISSAWQGESPPRPARSHLPTQVSNLFSKAADMIGYAMDLDGLVFFDAISTGAQHRSANQPPPCTTHTSFHTESHRDDTVAVALSEYRGAEQQLTRQPTQSLIQRLTAKYSHGHVFAVDEYGIFEHEYEHGEDVTQHITSDSLARDEWNDLFKCVPKARYVLFLPLWHYQRESCYATCLVWVSDTGKTLDTGDVNSLAAFGNSLMAEIFRSEAMTNTQSKSDFVSSISHELRSPLHGIMATIELMQNEVQITDLLFPMINMIDSCASTLLDTFDHLLEYSSINGRAATVQESDKGPDDQATHAHTSAEAVDLASMVEDVLETVSLGHEYSSRLVSGLRKERHDVLTDQLTAPPSQPVIITTHFETGRNWILPIKKGAWKRILLNIVSNALKYTKSGYINVHLSLLETDGENPPHISFSVSDTGVGMSQDFLKYHLFTPFMQENVLTPGTGLGLSLVKSIVESLQGKIFVDSRSGEGTRVTVNVPCAHGFHDVDQPSINISTATQDKLRGKTIGLLTISPPSPSDPTSTLRIVKPAEVLERSVRNTCEQTFGMTITEVLDGVRPETDIVLVDAHTLTSLYNHDLDTLLTKTLFSATPPALVVLSSSEKGASLSFGGRKATLTTSPVTRKRLGAALLSALKSRNIKPNLPSAFDSPDTVTANDTSTCDPPTTKTTTLPIHIQPSHATPTAIPSTTQSLRNDLAPPPPTHPCRFKRLLLVDDNLINLKLLSAFAKRLNVPYSTATDGAEAVEMYRNAALSQNEKAKEGGWRYDCVFMDISMPVMDGFRAVAAIRRLEDDNGRERAYIFALTGLGSEKARKEARSVGFDEFLLKPVRFKDVLPLLGPLPG